MKLQLSKIFRLSGLALLFAGLNACSLFKGEKYSSQWEVETEVPTSLEGGKPSKVSSAEAVAANAGVPADSNLIDLPETSSDSDGAHEKNAVEQTISAIPRPDIAERESPAEILRVPAPSEIDMNRNVVAELPAASPHVVEEKVMPMETGVVTDTDLVGVPTALKSLPGSPTEASEPGIPLLHSTTRLSDFYQNLHRPLLPSDTVSNIPQTSVPATTEHFPGSPEISAPSIYPEDTPIPSDPIPANP